jgi:hypothetical protein
MNDWQAFKPTKKQEVEIKKCKKCNGSWLELIEVGEYSEYHQVVLAQKPVVLNGPFFILKCHTCNTINELTVTNLSENEISKNYRRMLNDLDAQ